MDAEAAAATVGEITAPANRFPVMRRYLSAFATASPLPWMDWRMSFWSSQATRPSGRRMRPSQRPPSLTHASRSPMLFLGVHRAGGFSLLYAA